MRLRRFLAGLSADELEFLAGFQGARILERSSGASSSRRRADYGSALRPTADHDHKLLVLREYLARCGRPGLEGEAYFNRTSTREGRSAPGLA